MNVSAAAFLSDRHIDTDRRYKDRTKCALQIQLHPLVYHQLVWDSDGQAEI